MGRDFQILRNEKEEMGDQRGVDGTTNSKETKEEKRGKRVLVAVSITNHNLIFFVFVLHLCLSSIHTCVKLQVA